MISAWAVRWVTMMEVQTIPRFDVGPFPLWTAYGESAGLLGIIGGGLWLALALFASENRVYWIKVLYNRFLRTKDKI